MGKKLADGRKRRVDWKDEEIAVLVPKVVDLMTGDPKVSIGVAFSKAQVEVLSPDRRLSKNSLITSKMERAYGKLVEIETKRRARVLSRTKRIDAAKVAEQAAAAAPTAAPKVEPIKTKTMDTVMEAVNTIGDHVRYEGVTVGEGAGALVKRLIDNIGSVYEQALYEELRMAGRRAVFRAARDEAQELGFEKPQVPPAPAPREFQAMIENGGDGEKVKQEPVVPQRPKVALVGDPGHDRRYFDRIKSGLEHIYDFVEVGRLSQVRHSEGSAFVVFAGDATDQMNRAVRHVTKNAMVYDGKASTTVHELLRHQVGNYKPVVALAGR